MDRKKMKLKQISLFFFDPLKSNQIRQNFYFIKIIKYKTNMFKMHDKISIGLLKEQSGKLKKIAYIGYTLLFFLFYGGKFVLDEMGGMAVIMEYALLLIAYTCLGIKILMTEYTKKEVICGVVILFLAAVSFAFNRNVYLITNVVLVASLKDIELEELFRWCFWVGFFAVLMTMIRSLELEMGGGFLADRGWLEKDTVRMRYTFGYSTPNTCHMYLWRLEMLYIFGNYSKIHLPHIVMMLVLNLLLYQFTVSRTGFLGTLFLLSYLVFIKAAKKLVCQRTFGIALAIFYLLFGAGVCYLVLKMPDTDIFMRLDSILTRRLSLAVAHVKEMPISLFGHYNSDSNYIDCGWISMLLQWGVAWFCLYNIAMTMLILKSVSQRKPQLALVVFVSGIYGFGESGVMEKGVASISVLVIAELLHRREETVALKRRTNSLVLKEVGKENG